MNVAIEFVAQNPAISWILSVVVVGILINVASTYIQRGVDDFWSKRRETTKSKRVERETRRLWKLRRLNDDTNQLIIYVALGLLGIGWGALVVIIAIQFNVLARLPMENAPFMGEPLEGWQLSGFIVTLWITVALVLFMQVTSLFDFLDTLTRLRNFRAHEQIYFKTFGAWPARYQPSTHDITPPATASNPPG